MQMVSIIRSVILLSCLAFGLSQAQAANVEEAHFMYPLDYEYLLFNGLERLPSKNKSKQMLSNCNTEEVNSNLILNDIDNEKIQSHFLCRVQNKVKTVQWSEAKENPFWGQKAQVVYFGERHIDPHSQKEFAALLKHLAQDGFSVLAMEMFPFSVQDQIDDYFDDRISITELLSVLKKHWSYSQSGYREILIEAKKNRIKIIGIDQREGIQTQDIVKNIYERDQIMSERISEYMQNHPKDKVVVYSGSLHAPLMLSRSGLIQSQAQMLKDKLNLSHPDLSIESYILRTADKNELYLAISEAFSKPVTVNMIFLGVEAFSYANGIIYIHSQRSQNVIQLAQIY